MSKDYVRWGYRKNPRLAKLTEGICDDQFNDTLHLAFTILSYADLLPKKADGFSYNLGDLVELILAGKAEEFIKELTHEQGGKSVPKIAQGQGSDSPKVSSAT
jgi:hypothetical protein